MSLCEVSDCQLSCFFETRVAVLRQVFLPIPHLLALKGMAIGFVIQAYFNNAVNVAQALLQFKFGMAVQASFKGGDDLMLVQPKSAGSSDCQNEGPAKFFVVSSVEALNFFKFSGGAFSEAGFALLVGRFCGQFFAHHGFASQLWVRPYESNLSISVCIFQDLRHAVFEVRPRCKGAQLEGTFGNPWRVFIQAIQ